MHGTFGWIQVGTNNPEATKKFYGELFNWTFAKQQDGYDLLTAQGADQPQGGILATEGPTHAIFYLVVDDVKATAELAEQKGGKVVNGPVTTPTGLTFAELQDPEGNLFAVFKS